MTDQQRQAAVDELTAKINAEHAELAAMGDDAPGDRCAALNAMCDERERLKVGDEAWKVVLARRAARAAEDAERGG